MCRLIGFVTREPVIPSELLGETFDALVEVSHLHGDGWGLSWYGHDGALHLTKAPQPAHASPSFSRLLDAISSSNLIGHVRWATPGYTLCMENTHPFTRGRFAFVHNGAIAPRADIEALIAPQLRVDIQGTTDSERYFLALLSAFEKAAPLEAISSLLNTLRGHLQSTSLNCLLMTPAALYAVCDFDPQAPLARKEADYFQLQYRVARDAVVIGSSGLRQGPGWQTLQNGQVLLVARDTLDVEIVEIAQSKRSSLQEHFLSQLQR